MRRAMRSSDPKRLGKHTIRLPEEDIGDRLQLIFYQDEGGLRATDEANEGLDTIYYLGVIDILTPYSLVKKAEHLWKGLKADRVSSVFFFLCGRAVDHNCWYSIKLAQCPRESMLNGSLTL